MDDYDELLKTIAGKKIVKGCIGDSGFDVIFENGVVVETYDMCLLMQRMSRVLGGEEVDCKPFTRSVHERFLRRLIGRVVTAVEEGVDGCVLRFELDDGFVCLPEQYGYVVDVEE